MNTTQIAIVVVALLAFAISLYVLVFARRQRVTLEPPPADEPLPRRTFERPPPPPAPAASPVSEALSPPVIPVTAADPALTQVKGLGPKAAAQLAALGVTSIDALADLDEAAAEHIDADMGSFRGRMARDRWIEQARLLAAGDHDGFEATFGKLGPARPPA